MVISNDNVYIFLEVCVGEWGKELLILIWHLSEGLQSLDQYELLYLANLCEMLGQFVFP